MKAHNYMQSIDIYLSIHYALELHPETMRLVPMDCQVLRTVANLVPEDGFGLCSSDPGQQCRCRHLTAMLTTCPETL